jgi:mono/diheme cytochrome c family protein
MLGVGAAAMITVAGCGSSQARQTESGKAVFSRECGACHSLSGRHSPRQEGDDLSGLRVSRGSLREFAAEMPVPRPLTRADLSAVVNYILSVERRDRLRRPR